MVGGRGEKCFQGTQGLNLTAKCLDMFVAHCSSMLYSTGPPESLVVTPNGEDITVENNSPLQIHVQVQDKAGNLTVQPRLNVVCKVTVTHFANFAATKQYQPRTPWKTSL